MGPTRNEISGFRKAGDHPAGRAMASTGASDAGEARRLSPDLLSLWTALPLQVDFDLICQAGCKHLSGVTRRIGAPKWGIRSRTPLHAPVRPVQFISPSSRKL